MHNPWKDSPAYKDARGITVTTTPTPTLEEPI